MFLRLIFEAPLPLFLTISKIKFSFVLPKTLRSFQFPLYRNDKMFKKKIWCEVKLSTNYAYFVKRFAFNSEIEGQY